MLDKSLEFDIEPDYTPELDRHLETGRYWLTDIVDALYKDTPFNEEHFERCLEELLAVHGMSIPAEPLRIRPIKYRDIARES